MTIRMSNIKSSLKSKIIILLKLLTSKVNTKMVRASIKRPLTKITRRMHCLMTTRKKSSWLWPRNQLTPPISSTRRAPATSLLLRKTLAKLDFYLQRFTQTKNKIMLKRWPLMEVASKVPLKKSLAVGLTHCRLTRWRRSHHSWTIKRRVRAVRIWLRMTTLS